MPSLSSQNGFRCPAPQGPTEDQTVRRRGKYHAENGRPGHQRRKTYLLEQKHTCNYTNHLSFTHKDLCFMQGNAQKHLCRGLPTDLLGTVPSLKKLCVFRGSHAKACRQIDGDAMSCIFRTNLLFCSETLSLHGRTRCFRNADSSLSFILCPVVFHSSSSCLIHPTIFRNIFL